MGGVAGQPRPVPAELPRQSILELDFLDPANVLDFGLKPGSMDGQKFVQVMPVVIGARRIRDSECTARFRREIRQGVRPQPLNAPSAFVLREWPENAHHVLVQHYSNLRR